MRILLTNDDGCQAAGLDTLRQTLMPLGQVLVVAPNDPQSGVGHRVTTRTPLRLQQLGDCRYCVDGTPADCVRIGLSYLAPEVDWVIAGINAGANLGTDTYPSGTVAAAREAAILGKPAIAVSQYISRGGAIDWPLTGQMTGHVLRRLMSETLPAGHFWNVNLPHPLVPEAIPEIVYCDLETQPHRFRFREQQGLLHYEGILQERFRNDGTDVAVCLGGAISITRLGLRP